MARVSTTTEPTVEPNFSTIQVCIMDLSECIRDLSMISLRHDGPHATLGGIAIGLQRVAHRIMNGGNLDGFMDAEMITSAALKAVTRKANPLEAKAILEFLRDPNDRKTSGG